MVLANPNCTGPAPQDLYTTGPVPVALDQRTLRSSTHTHAAVTPTFARYVVAVCMCMYMLVSHTHPHWYAVEVKS
jgi:hypothetical protein